MIKSKVSPNYIFVTLWIRRETWLTKRQATCVAKFQIHVVKKPFVEDKTPTHIQSRRHWRKPDSDP